MQCNPTSGMLRSYQQIPLEIICQSRIQDEMIIWTKNFALIKDDSNMQPIKMENEPYEYSAVFTLTGE